MVIGITGGIGSGKSTVCKVLECMGYVVYYSDSRAAQLMQSDTNIIEELKEKFSSDIYHDGIIDRKLLASKVFGNIEKLRCLEAIVHPRVMEDLQKFITAHSQNKFVFVESAIMFESKLNHLLDAIITISAPTYLRIERVIKRDHTSPQAVEKRIAAQMSDSEREKLSNYTIVCDDHKCVTTQLLAILEKVSF
ncbi:MAG: dephospho-CoA kinase [Rikenellaceae bacterium]